ncbi:FKBP-type peptidyl-prolyl cis-trans isomerase, partial [Candidatus Ornithobacterium hominis]
QRNSPLNVKVGQTSLIQGWMEALTMFEKGSKVFLIVPSTLGYGTQGAGPIPANSTLYFEYEPLK